MTNTSQYKCPTCGADISLDDVNIAQDIALCRSCGQSCRFSELINQKENESILSEIPHNLRVEKTMDGITLSYKRYHWTSLLIAGFAITWNIVIWTAFLSAPKIPLWFLAVFILAGLLILGLAIVALFGKQVISIQSKKGTYFKGVGKLGITRHFSLLPQTTLTVATTTSYSRNPVKTVAVSQTYYKLIIGNPPEKNVTIGGILDPTVVPYIKSLLTELKK